MEHPISLTLNEAGYVIGQSSAAINRAVDRGVIRAKLQRRGKIRLRKIGPAELRYLAIAGEVEKDLTPSARRKVYDAMRRLPPDAHRLAVGVIEFKLTDVDQRIAERLRRLEKVKELIDAQSAADPLIRGTNVPAYEIAALTRGQTAVEILEDYPGMSREQVEAAAEFAKVYPKPGRPLPPRSFKRMLSDMAESGVWEIESDDEVMGPRLIP